MDKVIARKWSERRDSNPLHDRRQFLQNWLSAAWIKRIAILVENASTK